MFDNATQKRQALNARLVEAAKANNIEEMHAALMDGADPNCPVPTKHGSIRIYDFCKNLKGKSGKDALDVIYRFGGRSEKGYAQRKRLNTVRITMTMAKRLKDEEIRRRIKAKAEKQRAN